jgi:LysM repeat protein
MARYTVQLGDTLLGIAQQRHVSMAAIQLANSLGESDMIRAGQALDIPAGPHWEDESPYWIVHVVRGGETVTGIAQAFGLTTRDILRVNAIADAGQIMRANPSSSRC